MKKYIVFYSGSFEFKVLSLTEKQADFLRIAGNTVEELERG